MHTVIQRKYEFFLIKNRIEIMRNYNVLFINLFFNIKKVIIFKKKLKLIFQIYPLQKN